MAEHLRARLRKEEVPDRGQDPESSEHMAQGRPCPSRPGARKRQSERNCARPTSPWLEVRGEARGAWPWLPCHCPATAKQKPRPTQNGSVPTRPLLALPATLPTTHLERMLFLPQHSDLAVPTVPQGHSRVSNVLQAATQRTGGLCSGLLCRSSTAGSHSAIPCRETHDPPPQHIQLPGVGGLECSLMGSPALSSLAEKGFLK